MRARLSRWLTWGAWLGVGALAVQRVSLAGHYGELPSRRTKPRQGISILKPLCGVDAGLEESLQQFVSLPYAPYELLLGCESMDDPAWELAGRVAAGRPHVRRVLRENQPGLNPKVNQLATLARHARYDILLISDANIRPPAGYLDEMSAMFEDPTVGLATNPFTGKGHQTLGALFDNLHAATNSASHVAGKRLLGLDFVMGGSEAIRRSTLAALGGFEAYSDVLAEDYLLGRDTARAGWKVSTGKLPVYNVAPERTVESFYKRFARWGQMQATATGSALPAVGLLLLNPIALAGLAVAVAPRGARPWKTFAAVVAAKTLIDLSNAKALGVEPLGLAEAVAVPLKDAVLFGSWATGLASRTVDWRGKKFKVGSGTKLSSLDENRPYLGSTHRPRLHRDSGSSTTRSASLSRVRR